MQWKRKHEKHHYGQKNKFLLEMGIFASIFAKCLFCIFTDGWKVEFTKLDECWLDILGFVLVNFFTFHIF